ncbi:MAG TPA: carboxylating nicotinate-nucleotide diphosphorylase, partial [bacterium]|nr:carboxylating nicotinate-nucleotide diphosphorylase [bacterium]
RVIRQALGEDLGKKGDLTVAALFPKNFPVKSSLIAKSNGILCGRDVFAMVFTTLSWRFQIKWLAGEGEEIEPGQVVAEITGPVRETLMAERTALNFLQRLSGIATLTRRFVQEAGNRVKILDTRKTTPNLRLLEKYAVRVGGGLNHRFGLFDLVLIKDNHLTALQQEKCISKNQAISLSVEVARKKSKNRPVEIEVNSLQEALTAYHSGASIIMFDNARPDDIKRFARLVRAGRKVILEWSGGVTLENLKRIRQLPVDWVSVGALTHSAVAVDFSLSFDGKA